MKIGIIGAGKVGVSIATLLEISEFADTVILGDSKMVENLDGLRKSSFHKTDVTEEEALQNWEEMKVEPQPRPPTPTSEPALAPN